MYGSYTCSSPHFSMNNLKVLTRNNSDPTQYHRYHLAWHSRFIAGCNISSLEDWWTLVAKINLNENSCKLELIQAVLLVANITLTGTQSLDQRIGLTCASSILWRGATINRKRRAPYRHRLVDQGVTLEMSRSHSGVRAERGGRQPTQYEAAVKRYLGRKNMQIAWHGHPKEIAR
jgi:hypothetical protein